MPHGTNKNINMEQFQNLTAKENTTLIELNQLQKTYWPKFLNQSFPGLDVQEAPDINGLDWLVIMLNQGDPELYAAAYALQTRCANVTNTSCFEQLMDPTMNANTINEMSIAVNDTKDLIGTVDFTAAFESVFKTLWRAKLPCFDTKGMSSINMGERGILKKCSWKGLTMSCASIFTTFPTDKGMCCSFNMKAADEMFAESQYSTLVMQLQREDLNASFENSTHPDWYTSNNEPTTQSGKNMGLEIVLDAHSDVVESFSINSDFEGFTGLITDPGSFPLTNLKGFEVKPGHNNLVAVSAVKIDADDDLKDLKPEVRKCLYPDEIGNLKLFKTYGQANCFLECSLTFAQKKLESDQNLTQGCTPWYFPFVDDHFKMCDPYQTLAIWYIMQNEVPSEECNYCLPDCIRTIYTQSVTTQPFRRCDERNLYLTNLCTMDLNLVTKPQIWGRQVIDQFMKSRGKIPTYLGNVESSYRKIKDSYVLRDFFHGLPKEYDAYEKDIAILNVFFDSATVMKFKSQKRQSWTDYFANVGGALGLCIGLSIITVVELIWLCLRMCGLCKRTDKDPNEVQEFEDLKPASAWRTKNAD
jgi:hypothetical protein